MKLNYPNHPPMFDPEAIAKINEELANKMVIEEDNPLVDNSERSTAALESIRAAIEKDRQERIEAEKSAKCWQLIGIAVGVLTLIATVVFGVLTALG